MNFRLIALMWFACMGVIAHAQQDAEVLVSAGDVVVTRADAMAELARAPEPMRAATLGSPKSMHAMLNTLMVRRLLAREALANGLADTKAVREQVRLGTERVLSDARLLQWDAENEPDTNALEAYAKSVYAAEPQRFQVPAMVHARHILIRGTDDAALAQITGLEQQLRDGAKFQDLAKARSQDPGSAVNGGDLGTFPEGKMVAEFDAALRQLQSPGEISKPVKTQFGWHLIQLVQRTPAHMRSFDEVRKELVAEARTSLLNEKRQAKSAALAGQARFNDEAIDALLQKPAR